MDYFYNSIEFSSRAKLSEKEKEMIFIFIYSIISIYKDIIDDKVNHINSICLFRAVQQMTGYSVALTTQPPSRRYST